METEKSQDEVIINDCRYLGNFVPFWKDENPKTHFACEMNVLSQQANCCMFPYYIKTPKCCKLYTSGGEKKVVITKKQLDAYYKHEVKSLMSHWPKGEPDVLKE